VSLPSLPPPGKAINLGEGDGPGQFPPFLPVAACDRGQGMVLPGSFQGDSRGEPDETS
jgi:hypothetical protein